MLYSNIKIVTSKITPPTTISEYDAIYGYCYLRNVNKSYIEGKVRTQYLDNFEKRIICSFAMLSEIDTEDLDSIYRTMKKNIMSTGREVLPLPDENIVFMCNSLERLDSTLLFSTSLIDEFENKAREIHSLVGDEFQFVIFSKNKFLF